MKVTVDYYGTDPSEAGHVRVTLSRRNLLTLLAKLDGYPTNSACTIFRECEGGETLHVTAEEDAVHYAEREPGEMHPVTETQIAEVSS